MAFFGLGSLYLKKDIFYCQTCAWSFSIHANLAVRVSHLLKQIFSAKTQIHTDKSAFVV